jgi:hypothetical protein
MYEKIIASKSQIKSTYIELGALSILGKEMFLGQMETNVSVSVKFDINTLLDRHEYHVKRFLYHAENFISILENKEFKQTFNGVDINGPVMTVWDEESLFYEFDSFIFTLTTLFEEPFKKDAQFCLNKTLFKKFEEIFPSKDRPDSLIWRLTIIRNRLVHPDQPTYSQSGDRFMEYSSKFGNAVELKNGKPFSIKSHLLDIETSEFFKLLLKEVIEATKIVKKEFKNHKKQCKFKCIPQLPDFHSLLFNRGTSTKKEPNIVVGPQLNLLKSFYEILIDSLSILKKINQLYFEDLKEKFNSQKLNNIGFHINEKGLVSGWTFNKTNDKIEPNHIKLSEIFELE